LPARGNNGDNRTDETPSGRSDRASSVTAIAARSRHHVVLEGNQQDGHSWISSKFNQIIRTRVRFTVEYTKLIHRNLFQALELLLVKLETNNLFAEMTSPDSGRNNTAYLPSLAVIVGLKHLLESLNVDSLMNNQLPELLSVLLKYLAGWLHVEAPTSMIHTRYGYVPNRAMQKINPHTEVYSVLVHVLTIIQPNAASNLPEESVRIRMFLRFAILSYANFYIQAFSSETQAEESVILTVRILVKCMSMRNEVLSSIAQSLGKLMTSTMPIQRAVAATFYAELIGRVDCGNIWLDTIINILHEAKADSSPLIRRLATIGLARIAYLEPMQVKYPFRKNVLLFIIFISFVLLHICNISSSCSFLLLFL